MDKIALGNFLAELRNEKNLTQEDLAEQLNISSKTISKWECGTSSPDIETLKVISTFYNVSLYELMYLYKRNKNPLISHKNLQKIVFKDDITRISVLKIGALVISFLLLVGFILASIYTINNYGKVVIYDIASDNEDFYVEGYLIKTNKEYRIIISKIYYISNNTDPIINSNNSYIAYYLNTKLYKQNTIELTVNKKTSFSQALEKIQINEVLYTNKNISIDCYIIFEFFNSENKYIEYKIKLFLTNKYQNNQLFY